MSELLDQLAEAEDRAQWHASAYVKAQAEIEHMKLGMDAAFRDYQAALSRESFLNAQLVRYEAVLKAAQVIRSWFRPGSPPDPLDPILEAFDVAVAGLVVREADQ